MQLPRTDRETLAERFNVARLDEWDFLWTDAPPPRAIRLYRRLCLTGAPA
ncbi:GNAT family N-acetyltransferase, partial [Micromonospora sp. KC606]